ncbi:hypothetical protein GW17_00048281 [Ensete ventricosum]|nr:hypothetical protein GW17_00048281 [Ensete ventricosum]
MAGSMKLQPNNGPRSSLSIGPGFGRCSGFRREFARRFAGGIMKLAENTLGDHWGEDQKTCRKIQATASNFRWVNRPSGGQPPKWRLNRPYHRMQRRLAVDGG